MLHWSTIKTDQVQLTKLWKVSRSLLVCHGHLKPGGWDVANPCCKVHRECRRLSLRFVTTPSTTPRLPQVACLWDTLVRLNRQSSCMRGHRPIRRPWSRWRVYRVPSLHQTRLLAWPRLGCLTDLCHNSRKSHQKSLSALNVVSL